MSQPETPPQTVPLETNPGSGLYDSLGRPLDKMPDALRPGSNTVLFNDAGQVLLHKRSDNGAWALPGGAMEIGESMEECAVREMFETGLHVRIKRLVGVYSDPKNYCILRYPNGYAVHYLIVVYEVEQIGGELLMSEESTELRYFDIDALPEGIMPSSRMRVLDALQQRAEAFSK
jgi:ADP-ribose pyrophosphatase YjhB (NUDIX family)